MALYKRGGVWWFEFVFNGARVRGSTKQGNRRMAEQIESARRTQLVKGEVGIQDRRPVPTLREFAPRFERAIEMQCAEKPRTGAFYKSRLASLLASDGLASRRIDCIDEAVIEEYVQLAANSNSGAAPHSRPLRSTANWRRFGGCCASRTSGRRFSAFPAYDCFEANTAANRS
jgi:hypothetical protein